MNYTKNLFRTVSFRRMEIGTIFRRGNLYYRVKKHPLPLLYIVERYKPWAFRTGPTRLDWMPAFDAKAFI